MEKAVAVDGCIFYIFSIFLTVQIPFRWAITNAFYHLRYAIPHLECRLNVVTIPSFAFANRQMNNSVNTDKSVRYRYGVNVLLSHYGVESVDESIYVGFQSVDISGRIYEFARLLFHLSKT